MVGERRLWYGMMLVIIVMILLTVYSIILHYLTSPHSTFFFSIACYTLLSHHLNLNLIPRVLNLGTSVIAKRMRNIFYLSPLFLSVINFFVFLFIANSLLYYAMVLSSLFSCQWILYLIYFFNILQIPLGCVFIRYLILALSSPAAQGCFLSMSQPALLLVFMFWFSIFVLCKIAVGLGLIRYAGTCTVSYCTVLVRSAFILCMLLLLYNNLILYCLATRILRRVHISFFLPYLFVHTSFTRSHHYILPYSPWSILPESALSSHV
jgi:hypothetical protein